MLSNELIRAHLDGIAKDYNSWQRKNAYYYRTIASLVARVVRPGSSVLVVGCKTGDLLASSRPGQGVGIDISPLMIKLAREKYPRHTFFESSIEEFSYQGVFDYVIMADMVDHVYDVVSLFEGAYRFCHPGTKIIITTINPWWEPVLSLAERMGAKMPEGPHNFIEKRNLAKMIEFLDYAISYSGYLLLMPKYIPLVSFLVNAIGTRIWGLNKLSFVQYMVLHPLPADANDLGYGCSVIIPCFNESANIEEAVSAVPAMGKATEIIVVNDGSEDRTAEVARVLMARYRNLKLIDYQPNKGKGYAVQQGFQAASQEVLMILDADRSVLPGELPRFFAVLNKKKGDFVNGTRMVYPMEYEAMRFFNLLGNKIFGLIMTFIVGQHLTDTLCGTKALLRKDFVRMRMGLDRWGDFDLLFGAARLGLKIVEMPVHYKARKAGASKMNAIRHGFHLLRACFRGFKELVLTDDSSE